MTTAPSLASPLIVAMDFDNPEDCLNLAKQLNPDWCRLKVGKELFVAGGPKVVEQLSNLGFEIFLDLKFHDIPNTVAKAIRASANLGVWMVNVHCSGGLPMMMAAQEALDKLQGHRPLIIGVTVLTSMAAEDLKAIGLTREPIDQVVHFAAMAQKAGLDGVVCSAQEAGLLKKQLGQSFCLVTPGIRPQDSAEDDQHRIMTPKAAVEAGSDYLVIGRPITQALDPASSCQQILQTII